MEKTFTKGLFLLLLPLLVITAAASAQTITVGAIDPGPYGRGSSITLPFHIDNTSGCIPINNTFRLVLSNAAGSFATGTTVLTTKTGFYETFLNGIIPQTILPGTAYRLRIESTSAPNSPASNPFTISAAGAVLAGVTSQTINNNNPEVFGVCSADIDNPPPPYNFDNTSTVGSNVTAVFFNEFSQTASAPQAIPTAFNADPTNYTVIVRAEKGSVIGTKSYTLINNTLYYAFGGTTSTTVCLGSQTPLTYTLPLGDDAEGKQGSFKYNYPGLIYNVKWGDGTPDDKLTFCQISAAQGKLSHIYTQSSCGNTIGTQKNVFQVDFVPTGVCTNLTPFTGYAKVLTQPTNSFSYPENACTNTNVTFFNTSDPGMDPNNNGPACINTNARYRWSVKAPDGTIFTSPSLSKEQNFVYPFPARGKYTVTLKLVSSNGLCTAVDVPRDICIQDPPKPDFNIPAIYCLASGPLTPVDQSIVDPGCDANTPVPTYRWIQTGGSVGGVTFNANLKIPSFTFNAIGVYKFRLEITTASCGTVSSIEHTIVVNDAPTATLDQDRSICGQGVTLSFDPAATTTKSVLDGTAQPAAATYTWTVTGGAFAFVGGTNLHSQYPKIRFDNLAAYTITATHVNNCGPPATDQQILTFVPAPTVIAGTYAPVCQGTPIALNGSPGVGGLVTGVTWIGTPGGTFVNQDSPTAIYNPSAADIAAGQVTLTYQATTSLAAPCNVITDQTTIAIIKTATVTSSPTPPPICSGSPFSYTITAANPATTFTWSGVVTSGTATGYPANGGISTITAAAITNTGTTDAIITYTILPTLNGCSGTPFTLKVTVHPLPVITALPVTLEICSNLPANITLTSNIAATTYVWESTTSNPAITGNTNSSVPSAAPGGIQDVLINNSDAVGTVTYKITPYNGTCPGPFKTITRTVKPAPKTPDPGPDAPICAQTQYQLHGNDPSPGTGKWTLASSQVGVTFSNANAPNATAFGLQPGQVYQFKWEITSADCPPKSAIVTITNNAQAVGGVTAGTTTICAGSTGQITLTGQVGTIVWQRSIDGGLNWVNIPGQTTATLTYPPLTQTTQYRASVTNGSCGPVNSTVSTITVVQPPPAAVPGTYGPLCNEIKVTLTANNPGTFVGKWTRESDGGPPAHIVDENNFTTDVTGLLPGNTYKFRWTIFANAPCTVNPSEVTTIINGSDLTPDFHPSTQQVCGTGSVLFTNTTPDLPGIVYEWNFGDGSPVSHEKSPSHPFQPNADKSDVVRHVSLTITSNCNAPQTKIVDITVSPLDPDARLRPPTDLRSCGDLNLSVENASLGTNDEYTFHLVDENGADVVPPVTKPRGDKSIAVFQTAHPTHIATWHLYVEAKNNCDRTAQSVPFDIPVSPSNISSFMQIKDNPTFVCLGTPVFFRNLSTGGDAFKYNIYDVDRNINLPPVPGGLADLSFTFPHAGNYQVTITASNAGCGDAAPSPIKSIEVVPLPQPDFDATVDIDNNATFVNKTPDAGSTPKSSLVYEWNFGDGSPVDHNFTPAKHFYKYENSPYTVTLTATIPGNNCSDIRVKTIEIKFTGELFLPNAFQPASTKTELRTFKAKGQKLKEWRMQIFNNWGQLVWQTTALNSNGEPVEGWDGTFKGAPAQQGVYIWQITAKFLNGSDWKGMSYRGSLPKRTGTINLIR
jgi:PKD repeat protein